jgi:hypothetical protein
MLTWLSRALLLAVISCAGLTAPAAAAPPPGGVYAIIVASDAAEYDVTAQALQQPGIDGLLIHLRWDQISPSLMQYDWTTLDKAVQLATDAHKRFEIGIVTGAAMPGWIYAPPPMGLGAQSATFDVDAIVGGGCTTYTMSPPYDPAYLRAFHDLLHQLAAHLRSTKTYAHLSMVKLFGVTTTTDELRLPALAVCGGNAVETWQSLGYTPAKVEAAWNTMLQDYLQYFPQNSFNIGFIGINAFPGIRDDGSAAATTKEAEKLSSQIAAKLMADAGAAMPGRLALGFDSLTLNLPEGDRSYIQSRHKFFLDAAGASARPGWQTNELLGSYPKGGAACGGSLPDNAVPCANAAEFKKMLLRGIYPKGKLGTPPSLQGVYLELFPQNIVAFPEAIPPAHDNLASWLSN